MGVFVIASEASGRRCWRGLRLLVCVGMLAAGMGKAMAGPYEVTLAWDLNPEPDVVGYRIHHGIASGEYITTIDVGNTSTATVAFPGGGTYHVVATAYNSAGLESLPSEEIVVFVGAAEGDAEAPVFESFPGDLVVLPDFIGGTTAGVFWDEPTVTDNVGVVSLTSTFGPGSQFTAGTTTVTYTALDAAGNLTNESFTVTVAGIDLWRSETFGAGATDPAVGGDLSNSDGDRWANLGEYALGLDTTANDGEDAFSQLIADGQHVLRFQHNPYLADVVLRIEGCGDVSSEWAAVATLRPGNAWFSEIEEVDISSHREGDRQEVTIIIPAGLYPAAFYRLSIALVDAGGAS